LLTLIEALRYRRLKYARHALGRVAVVAGPPASGKATLLDVPMLAGSLVANGPEAAIAERARAFDDLLWMRQGGSFELAVEAAIPEDRRHFPEFDTVRYEIAVGAEGILSERVLLKAPGAEPQALFEPDSILTGKGSRFLRTVVHKGSSDYFYEESGKGWVHNFRLGPRRAALGHLPDEPAKFPVTTWLRDLLAEGIRRPPESLTPLPVNLRRTAWLEAVRRAIPELSCVANGAVRYTNGLETSLISESTRRVLTLAAPVFTPGYAAVLIVEKPETGLDATLTRAVFEILEKAEGMQVLLSTHSPEILERAPEQIRTPPQ